MDKSLKNFIFLVTLLTFFFFSILAFFSYAYRYSTINVYNNILLIIIMLTIIITLFFILEAIAVYFAYKTKSVSNYFLWPVKLGLKGLLPFIIFISGFFKGNKDSIRRLYIDINNILTESIASKYRPEEVIILVPHCLQNSECKFKVTNDIYNCKKCGNCCIGDIAAIAEKSGAKASVVTGGTAARNIIEKNKPKMVLSVACERDLTSGIADVGNIPVIGVVNKRPNGPCYNTVVDINIINDKISSILKQ